MSTETAVAGPARSTSSTGYLPRPFVVRHVHIDGPRTSTLTLESLDGRPLPFRPGQFTMIGRPGYAEVPISICGDPGRPDRLEHTVRAVGEASGAVAGSARGDVLLVRGPYGHGWEVADAEGRDVVFLAGGIGMAPLRPALLEVLRNRARYGRVVLVYGSRDPAQLLYRHELERWRGRLDVEVAVTVDAAPPGWRGLVGVVTTAIPLDLDPHVTSAYVCGPEIMMRLTATALVADRGLPPGRVRVSLERNMKCGLGLCGHCQLRELFVCTDGPVFGFDRVRPLLLEGGL